jgi:hypothetical protein
VIFHSKAAWPVCPPASKAKITARILIRPENLNHPRRLASRIRARENQLVST